MKPNRSVSLAVLGVLALLLTPSTQACDDGAPVPAKANVSAPEETPEKGAPRAPSTKSVGQAPAPGAAGRIVTRDPGTGELRAATAEEANRLRASERTALATPAVSTVLPDGTVRLEPGERGLAYATLEKRPDGTLKPGCVAGRDPSKTEAPPAKPVADEK